MVKVWSRRFTAVGMVLMVAACGGGGSDDPSGTPATQAQGIYLGTVTGSSVANAFNLAMLENGEFWALYGISSGGSLYVSGFVQGTALANGSNLRADNVRDFYAGGDVYSGTLTGTIGAGAIQGSVTANGRTISLSGTSSGVTTVDYNKPAVLSDIVGNWSMTVLNGATASVSINASGAITGSSSGCAFTGTVVPRPSGKAVFNVSVTFGGAPCALPNQSASGIGVLSQQAAKKQLVVAVVNGQRTAGVGLFGLR